MTNIAVVGTSGNKKNENNNLLSKAIFDSMVNETKQLISNYCRDKSKITLISGGSAWADHIAVILFLNGECGNLKLHFPCEWNNNEFSDAKVVNWIYNPGGTLNYYHNNFSNIMGYNTLTDISNALNKGAIYTISKGFHARNSLIAESDYLIAFTWSKTSQPDDGGTMDTWKKFKGSNKIHIGLEKYL